jgi:hypothetical protein
MENKFDTILGNTMSTISSDLASACAECDEELTEEGLAESAIDMLYMYGGDQVLIKEFGELKFNEQIKIAQKVATYYI